MTCARCNGPLTYNELGLNAKFNAAREKLCIRCLAEKLGVTQQLLREKTEEFIRAGCTMFTKE